MTFCTRVRCTEIERRSAVLARSSRAHALVRGFARQRERLITRAESDQRVGMTVQPPPMTVVVESEDLRRSQDPRLELGCTPQSHTVPLDQDKHDEVVATILFTTSNVD
jgi:hypothetical protein